VSVHFFGAQKNELTPIFPKQSVGKDNLTLKQLHHQLKEYGASKELLLVLSEQLTAIDQFCKPIRDLRNRIVGHLDLKSALKRHPQPLPNLTSEQITKALQLLAGFTRTVQDYFTTVEFDYDLHISPAARNIVHAVSEYIRLQPFASEMERRRLPDGE
jgi:hypothetical protein